jgi:DNA-binding MarR family transcriptional regulator/N-acetylglutamate synthase-like GNAT family acetyltransferase
MASKEAQPVVVQEKASHIAAVRAFNRFYTRQLGVLDQHVFQSPFSLSEARVLYELANRGKPSAREIGTELDLDAGYLSRIVQKFAEDGLVARKPLPDDKRQYQLGLTAKGRQAFAKLDRRSHDDVARMLRPIPETDRCRLTAAMATIERLLAPVPIPASTTLREQRPGDMGWIVQSHGRLYAHEYGWDSSFEALVAEIVAAFIRSFDASRERCWIAEIDGVPVGSVMLVRSDDEIAKLRLLLVEPAGRGQGLGGRLVGECISFARACGYRKITLWTQSILTAARKIYQQAGFVLVKSEPHRSFGQNLVGETWELKL